MKNARLRAVAAMLAVLVVMFTLVGCSNTTTTTPGNSTGNGTGGNPGNMMGGSNNQTGGNGY